MAREMKDSGVAWIGEIPREWNVGRLKDIKSNNNYSIVDGPFGTAISTSDYVDEGVPLVRIVNLDELRLNVDKFVYITNEHAAQLGRSRFYKGDIIFAKTGATVGKCALNTNVDSGILSSSCVKIQVSNRHVNRFFYYYFSTSQFNEALRMSCNGTTRDTINLKPFSSLYCIIPTFDEQQRIADYLDTQCAHIDAVIEHTRASIEEYKKLKQAVITQAVTKGIRSDREMKDSGIEWVGLMPEDWKSMNPKVLFTQRKEKATAGERQLTASQQYGVVFQDEYMEITGTKIVTVEKDFDILKHVETGDFIISMRSFQGGLEYSTKTGSISSAYVMLIPNRNKVYPRFYRWLFKSFVYINAIQSTTNMVRDGQAMRYSNFIQVRLYDVPLHEQKEIADYLDDKCHAIGELIRQKELLLNEMESYKKSLVFEYVTGKKEVPA